MKLIMALVVYLGMAAFLGWGIFHAAKGGYGPLAISGVVFAVAFGKFGCLPPKQH
ncbi:MAG: hypothetical protein HZA89_15105 [Verrucomicrobia bacterium]|nr:hypothetical protein [Verrucomicrobiota bacterium]